MKIEYALNDDKNGLVITGGKDLEGELIIPSRDCLEGKIYPIIAIGNNAFRGCKGLTSIVISDASLLQGTKVPIGVKIVKP